MNPTKLLFFALDSADSHLLSQWMDDGSLPNLATLRGQSLSGSLATPRGLGSDAVWPSVFTGVDASQHGRYHHKQDTAGSYRTPAQRDVVVRREPIWQRYSSAGRRVAVLDLPKAPLSDGLNGVQVVDWHSHYSYPEEFRTWPPDRAAVLTRQIAGHVKCPCILGRYRDYDPASDRARIESLLHTVDESLELVLRHLDSEPWDLLMTAFSQSHCIGHSFWHLHDPDHPRRQQAMYRGQDPVREVYAAIDSALGTLLARLGDDTALVVFAGAGMGPNYVHSDLLDDILMIMDRGHPSRIRRANARLKKLWRQLPANWRDSLAPLAHGTENRLVSRDRADRRYFAVQANDSVGGIRINLQGREPDGRVPAAEFDDTVDQLIQSFEEISLVDTGEKLVSDIMPARSIYGGEHLDQLPDILIEWNHTSPVSAVTSARIGTVRQNRLPQFSGTHRSGALLMIRSPGCAPGTLPADAGIYDIAPTLAALSGLQLNGMDGRSLVPE